MAVREAGREAEMTQKSVWPKDTPVARKMGSGSRQRRGKKISVWVASGGLQR